jgi:hypothetical protein
MTWSAILTALIGRFRLGACQRRQREHQADDHREQRKPPHDGEPHRVKARERRAIAAQRATAGEAPPIARPRGRTRSMRTALPLKLRNLPQLKHFHA